MEMMVDDDGDADNGNYDNDDTVNRTQFLKTFLGDFEFEII